MKNVICVIPFRNGNATLPALLASLPASLPVVVVDDLSDVAPDVSARPKTQVLRLTERGYFSGAVNAGVGDGKKDILILNQDVTLQGNEWQKVIDDNREEYAVIGDGVLNHPAWPKSYVQGTAMFITRAAWNAVGPFNARDYPLWGSTCEFQLRACRLGYKALPLSPFPGLVHARGNEPFGSSIAQTLAEEPNRKGDFIKTPPAISVVIPSYNYGRFLRDAVHSLIGGETSLGTAKPQTFQSFEIIIVNDASTDETDAIANELANEWQAIRYIKRETKGGTSIANNTGMQAARGKYVTHLSADDMMRPDRLEYLYRAAEANPGKVIYDDLAWFKDGGIFFEQKLPEYDFDTLLDHNTIHAGIFYERAAWQTVGGYPEIFANGREDWAMNLRLGRGGFCGLHVAELGYLYRREGQNRTLTNTGTDWHQFFLRKIRETFPDLYSGDFPMGCCGSGRAQRAARRGNNGASKSAALATATPAAPAGMTRVEYIGGSAGTQEWRIPPSYGGSGTRYVFNSLKRRFGYVDNRDLETGDSRHPGLLEMMENKHAVFRAAPLAEAVAA